MGTKLNKNRRVLKSNRLGRYTVQAEPGSDFVAAGPKGLHQIKVNFVGNVKKTVYNHGCIHKISSVKKAFTCIFAAGSGFPAYLI